MDRRTAIQMIGGALAAPLAGGRVVANAKAPVWKTAVGLNGFASSALKYDTVFPIWEVLDFVSRTGFDGVELMRGWPSGGYPRAGETQRIRALKRLYDAFGLKVFSLQLGAGGAFAPNERARGRWLERARDEIEFARQMGCEWVGFWPGGRLRGQTIEQAIEHLGASFRKVGQIVGEFGMNAAYEIEPPFVFNTEDHLKRMIAAIDHPRVKTIYDPSHFDLMNGSTGRPHEMLERIGVTNIGYVHLTDCDGTLRDGGTSKHLACGDGHIDIARSLKVLRDGGFTGWIMIDAWQIPDPYDAFTKGKRAIDRAQANA